MKRQPKATPRGNRLSIRHWKNRSYICTRRSMSIRFGKPFKT